MGAVHLPFLALLALQSVAEAASEDTKVTNVDLKNFFEWAVTPSDEVPSDQVVTAACVFLLRSVNKVAHDQSPKQVVSDAGIALKLCDTPTLRGLTQPRAILSSFLKGLSGNGLTSAEIANYVSDGGQPTMVFLIGPSGAGKGFGGPMLLSDAFAQDAHLKETSIFIHLDNDVLKEGIKKIIGDGAVKDAVTKFLVRCSVTIVTESRGDAPDLIRPIYSPYAGYRSVLLLVMGSYQTTSCDANTRAAEVGKPSQATAERWEASMNGVQTILRHFSESHVPQPVYAWFNEIVAICGHGDSCGNGESGLGMAGFCAKHAQTVSKGDLMQRLFVSVGPFAMEPSDLLDILHGDKIVDTYLHNLKHKSTTYQGLKPIFPTSPCTQPATTCAINLPEIMNVQGHPAPSARAPSLSESSGFAAIAMIAMICAAWAAAGWWTCARQKNDLAIPLTSGNPSE